MKNKLLEIQKTEYQPVIKDILQVLNFEHKNEEEWQSNEQGLYIICGCYYCKLMKLGLIETIDELHDYLKKDEFAHSLNTIDGLVDELDDLAFSKLLEISKKYELIQFDACIFYTDVYNYQIFKNEQLYELIDELLDIRKDEFVVVDSSDEFSFLINSKIKHEKARYIGYTDNYTSVDKGYLMNQIFDIKDIIYCCSDNETKTVDKYVIKSELGKEYEGETDNNSYKVMNIWKDFPGDESLAWNNCAAAIQSLKKTGRAIAIMQAGSVSNKYSINARKYLVDRGYVEGVIVLPDRLNPSMFSNTYLVLLKKGSKSIKFYDARECFIPGRFDGKKINILDNINTIVSDYKNKEVVKEVAIEEIARNEYVLLPQRYVTNQQYDKSIKLEDCVDGVSRGITLSAEEYDKYVTEYECFMKCITPLCISNGIISKYLYFKDYMFNKKKNIANKGDILINKTGRPYRAAVCDDEYLVVGNIYILRVDQTKYSSEYIKCYLESEKGQVALDRIAVGSKTPVISIANLMKFEIPLFKGKKQKELEKKAKAQTEKMMKLYREMSDCLNEGKQLFD